jgi:hypothetical protein
MSAEKLRNVAKIPGMTELIGTLGVELINDIADSYSDMYEALKALISEDLEVSDKGQIGGKFYAFRTSPERRDAAKQALTKAEGKE